MLSLPSCFAASKRKKKEIVKNKRLVRFKLGLKCFYRTWSLRPQTCLPELVLNPFQCNLPGNRKQVLCWVDETSDFQHLQRTSNSCTASPWSPHTGTWRWWWVFCAAAPTWWGGSWTLQYSTRHSAPGCGWEKWTPAPPKTHTCVHEPLFHEVKDVDESEDALEKLDWTPQVLLDGFIPIFYLYSTCELPKKQKKKLWSWSTEKGGRGSDRQYSQFWGD